MTHLQEVLSDHVYDQDTCITTFSFVLKTVKVVILDSFLA